MTASQVCRLQIISCFILFFAAEIAVQLQSSGSGIVVCFGPLEPLVRKALEINQQDLPIVTLGPQSPSKLPRVEEILSDTALGFADPEPVSRMGTVTIMVLLEALSVYRTSVNSKNPPKKFNYFFTQK